MVSAAAAEAGGSVRGPPEDLCLTFANTRFWRGTDAPTEELRAPEDFLRWCGAHSGLDAETLGRIEERWRRDPAAGATALDGAIALREALYRIFSSATAGVTPSETDLTAISTLLAGQVRRTRLCQRANRLEWALPADAPDLGLLLAPVLWSAGDLLTGRRLARVRRCANQRCAWLFLDDSKGGTRRWCAMSACGNRAKAHRHYAKVRATRPASA